MAGYLEKKSSECCGPSFSSSNKRCSGTFQGVGLGGPQESESYRRREILGHSLSTAGTFRKKFRKDSGKTPETLSERFLEVPSRVRLGCPKPYNSRHLRLPERFQNSLPPPQYGWGRLFFQKWFQRGPLRAGHGIPSSTGGISEIKVSFRRLLQSGWPGEVLVAG